MSEQYDPVVTGVYFLFKNRKLVYCGKSENAYQRIREHKQNGREFDYATIMPLPIADLPWIESLFIRGMRPEGNKSNLKKLDSEKERERYQFDTLLEAITSIKDQGPIYETISAPKDPNVIITLKEFCKINGISRETGKRLRGIGDFPPTVRLSPNRWGIRWGDCVEWQQKRRSSQNAQRT